MKKKEIKNLRTGALSRSLSLAGLGLRTGASAGAYALGSLWQSEAVKSAREKAHWLAQAGRIAQELGELKGSLMKAGQMFSVYGEHFLPPEANEILRTLQSDSPPVEWAALRRSLTRSLGKEKLAALEIDPEPTGAASLGQVHRARVKASGETLALKVQYPGVERAIAGDLRALRRLLSFFAWFPKIPATEQLFEEVRYMLEREVDYELERENLEFFGKALAGDSRYVVPRAYPDFSAKKVLAMSFEEGVKIDSPEVAALPQARRNAIAAAALEVFFRELFEWRRVQTDPHFGNFRVRLNPAGDRLVLLDFGAVRDLPAPFMKHYGAMLRTILHGERAEFEAAAARLGVLAPSDPTELKEQFFALCALIVEPFAETQPYAWESTKLPQRVTEAAWKMVRGFPLRSPPREMVFLDRKTAGVFTLMAKLRARIDARAILLPYLE